jgi:hypothetical protein
MGRIHSERLDSDSSDWLVPAGLLLRQEPEEEEDEEDGTDKEKEDDHDGDTTDDGYSE